MTIHGDDIAGFTMIAGLLAIPLAWVTHLAWTISILAGGGATFGQALLMLLGIFIPPLGMLHGVMIWFGYGVGA